MDKSISSKLAGDRLRKYRLRIGYTQSEFGSMLNLAQNTICKYETEGINDLDTINDISQKLGVNLLEDTDEDREFMNIILKRICKWYSTHQIIENFLTKDILQNKCLYGYGKDTKSLEYILKKLEEKKQLKTFKNRFSQEDTNTYILLTAKSILQFDNSNIEMFPTYLVADNITEETFQDIINGKTYLSDLKEKDKKLNFKLSQTQDIVFQNEKEAYENDMDCKTKHIMETINDKGLHYFSSDDIDAILKDGIHNKKNMADTELKKYFELFNELFPKENNVTQTAEKTYANLLSCEEQYTSQPDVVNYTYDSLVQLVCNILLSIYRKIIYGYNRKISYPKLTTYDIASPKIHFIDRIDYSKFIKEVIPFDTLDGYDYAATNLLMNAIVLYLLEDYNIGDEHRSVEGMLKLLKSSNGPSNIELPSPLDNLFLHEEQKAPSSIANKYYTSFKLASRMEQLRATTICINACFEYCEKKDNEDEMKIFPNMELIEELQSMHNTFTHTSFDCKNPYIIYISIYSEKLEDLYNEERKFYNVNNPPLRF